MSNKLNYQRYTTYLLERLEGKYNDSVIRCIITYTYTTLWYLGNAQPEDAHSNDTNTDLSVGEYVQISSNYWAKVEGKGIVRAYFDTVGLNSISGLKSGTVQDR